MAAFEDFLTGLKNDVIVFAESEWKNAKGDAIKDGNAFVQSCKADLQTWTNQLAAKQLTVKDFEFLVKGKKDLATLQALKNAGLAQAKLDAFVNGLIVVIVKSATKAFV